MAPSPRLSGSNHPAGAIVHVGTVPSVCGLCSAPWDVPGQGGHDGPSPYDPCFLWRALLPMFITSTRRERQHNKDSSIVPNAQWW